VEKQVSEKIRQKEKEMEERFEKLQNQLSSLDLEKKNLERNPKFSAIFAEE
jgi:hypothetical protein